MTLNLSTKNGKRTVSILLLFFTLAAALFGSVLCKNPFQTRKPEAPERSKPTRWKQPTQPKDVLENLQAAIQDENLTNYMNCFAEKGPDGTPYRFRPDQNAQIRHPGIWDTWDLISEQTYIANVFRFVPDDSILTLFYIGEGYETPSGDTTVIVQEYEWHIPHTRTGETFPRLAKGRAEFHLLRNEQGYWAIYLWIDDGFEGMPSWSDVKAAFVQ